jgi:hypothetical protein
VSLLLSLLTLLHLVLLFLQTRTRRLLPDPRRECILHRGDSWLPGLQGFPRHIACVSIYLQQLSHQVPEEIMGGSMATISRVLRRDFQQLWLVMRPLLRWLLLMWCDAMSCEKQCSALAADNFLCDTENLRGDSSGGNRRAGPTWHHRCVQVDQGEGVAFPRALCPRFPFFSPGCGA